MANGLYPAELRPETCFGGGIGILLRGTKTIITTITTEFLVAEAWVKIYFLTIRCLRSQGRRKGDPNINVVGKKKK